MCAPSRATLLRWSPVLCIVVLLGAVAWAFRPGDFEPQLAWNREPILTPEAAVEACRPAVLDALRAPATARFVEDASATRGDNDHWTVTGEVDAENGFSALIRNVYTCDMVWESDKFASTKVMSLRAR